MKLAWGAKVSPDFRQRAVAIALGLGSDVDPSWLMAAMYFESRLNPEARNAVSGATGLIQFMPKTAERLGTTTDELAAMSAEAQLNFVAAYFAPFKGQIRSLADLYMAILWPAAVRAPDAEGIFVAGSSAYAQNAALDTNKDHQVTKAEAAALVAKDYDLGMQDGNVFDFEDAPAVAEQPDAAPAPQGDAMPLLLALLPAVLNLFAPRAQAALQRVTGAPQDVVEQFAQTVIGKVQEVTGKPDPVQAVAAITADPKPEVVQQVQESALDHLDKLMPVLDKVAEWDQQMRASEIAGRDAASKRAAQDRWDMTPWLVWFAGGTATLLVLALAGAIIYQAIWGNDINTALIGLAGPLLAISMGVWREIFAYRFDSTPNSAAKDAVIAQLAQNK